MEALSRLKEATTQLDRVAQWESEFSLDMCLVSYSTARFEVLAISTLYGYVHQFQSMTTGLTSGESCTIGNDLGEPITQTW